jgi:hypothetical protein
MRETRRSNNNGGRICEKHRTIDTKTQIGTSKKRRRKTQMDKEKDNEDRQ